MSVPAEQWHKLLRYCLDRVVEQGASDLHIASDEIPLYRVNGELHPVPGLEGKEWPDAVMREVIATITTEDQLGQLRRDKELDCSIDLSEETRFRVNIHYQDQGVGAVLRQIPTHVASLESLGMPSVLRKFASLPRGLVLVTGPTGSGKSTTLAAMIDFINSSRREHIITIEDPIEFVHHSKRSFITQREVGRDTDSFPEALKRALRQDPDVILVGEMRDLETISTAITAAETGHLVFSTLHTQDAQQTTDRIIDMFPAARQEQIRQELAATLRGIVTQTLVPATSGGRVAAHEIMVCTPAIANMIRSGTTHQMLSALQAGAKLGMHTLDQHLASLVNKDKITRQSALNVCHSPETLAGYLSNA